MKKSYSIAENIFTLAKLDPECSIRHEDVSGCGTRAAVDQAFSRLVRDGRLRRIRRGIYEFPRQSPVLRLPVRVPTDRGMQAWAQNNGVWLIPCGAWAANLLHLSTQVPARMEYCTNGPSRRVMVDGTMVTLKHRGPRTMDVPGLMSAIVMEALRYFGRERTGEKDVQRLRALLAAKDKAELLRNRGFAPAWMRPIIDAIASARITTPCGP